MPACLPPRPSSSLHPGMWPPPQVLSSRAERGEAAQSRGELRFWRVAAQLYEREGLRGFSRGMAARVATISTGSAVSWFVYETVKRQLAQEEAQG